VLAGVRIDAKFLAILLERLGERRRRRDRIPGANGRAAVDATERGGGVAVDENAIADRIGLAHHDAERMREILQHVVAAEMQRLPVRVEQFFLALVLLAEQRLDDAGVDLEQRGQRAEIHDVLEQLPLPRIGPCAIGDLGQRHADRPDVVAELRFRERLRRVVKEVTAGLDLPEVGVPGLRIHRDHEIDAAAAAEMAFLVDAYFVPGRQALNVRREDVARADGHAHAQDRFREELVR
jgi:hypothetical protein